MCWAVTAASAAIATLLFSIFVFAYPKWQRHKWGRVLPRITELKDKAIDIQNEHWKDLSSDELEKFNKEVDDLKRELLDEIAKISKTKADRYNKFGTVDISPFLSIRSKHQRMLLGYIRRTWQIADEIIDKYS